MARKFNNCIKLSEQFIEENNKTIRKLIDENQEIENLILANFVIKRDFERDGFCFFIKERLAKETSLITNIELFCIFGSKINVCILKPRHYLTLTNYVRELAKLPMIECCNEKQCILRKQIYFYNSCFVQQNVLK